MHVLHFVCLCPRFFVIVVFKLNKNLCLVTNILLLVQIINDDDARMMRGAGVDILANKDKQCMRARRLVVGACFGVKIYG
jgi:hypothetical protein